MSVKALYQRIAALPPEKRALLERHLQQKQQAADAAAMPVRRPDQPVPVSLMQQRLWLLDQLAPGNLAYTLPIVAFVLQGKLNVRILQRTFEELERRHESLRTIFREIDGEACQIVQPPGRVPLPLVDLSHLDSSHRRDYAEEMARREGRRPFNLATGPLWRTSLWQLEPDHYLLLVIKHHIITDGWSLGVVYREVSTIYSAFLDGQPSPLPELAVQYRDFSL